MQDINNLNLDQIEENENNEENKSKKENELNSEMTNSKTSDNKVTIDNNIIESISLNNIFAIFFVEINNIIIFIFK